MGYRKIIPAIELQPFISHFWLLDVQEEDLPFEHTVLPFAWFELFFELVDSSRRKAEYVGQLSNAYRIAFDKPCRFIGVSLRPHVGNALFSIPANVLAGSSLDWSDLDRGSSLHDLLVAAISEKELIHLFESYLAEKLRHYSVDHVSACIAQRIIQQPSLGLSGPILSSIGLGRRRIEQRFFASTGVSMGTFVRKVRFDSAIDFLCRETRTSLTHAGLDLGYYDQAHFSREFKSFAGITPKAYRRKLLAMTELERALQ